MRSDTSSGKNQTLMEARPMRATGQHPELQRQAENTRSWVGHPQCQARPSPACTGSQVTLLK